jgi:hypothetical protein
MGVKSFAKVTHIYGIRKFFLTFSIIYIQKLSKIKMQITHNEQFANFINNKSFPLRKTYLQLKSSICVIRALQHVVPFLSTC